MPVRLAVLPEDALFASAVDLLTAELSRKESLQLLERAEIEKVYREQGLSAENKDYLRLGQILGADGLLLLSMSKDGPNQFLAARLVAVKPGVILGAVRSPWPLPDAVQWAKRVGRHFAPLFPKLGVLVKDAIPISVVNLRSALQSSEAQETERQLTTLAIERLTREPQFFVLERRRMELLGVEKELRGIDESPFWSGSYLLEGTIDRDGFAPETVTINARLMPPKGGAPIAIDINGSRKNLSEVVNRLAIKVAAAMKLNSGLSPWNPMDEAALYFDEAKWAFKWEMFREAQSASESSWALGLRNREVTELRIRSYREDAKPPQNGAIAGDPSVKEYAPEIRKLEPAVRAIELYQRDFVIFSTNGIKPDLGWYDLALDVLNSTSLLLRQFYFHPESQVEHQEKLAELRHAARDLVGMIEEAPAYKNITPAKHDLFFYGKRELFLEPEPELAHIEAGAGMFWQDTPEQCLAVYRKYTSAGRIPALRRYFGHGFLAGWNSQDQQRAPALWHNFIQELCSSTNALPKIEGYFMKFADAEPERQEQEAQAFFNVVIENAKPVAAAKLEDRLLHDIQDLLGSPPRGAPESSTSWRITRSFYAFRDGLRSAHDIAMRSLRLEAMKGYLTYHFSTNNLIAPQAFQRLFADNMEYMVLNPIYQASDADELLPLLRSFRAQLVERKARPENKTNYQFGSTLQYLDHLVSTLQGLAAAPQSATNSTAAASPVRAPAERPTITKQFALQIPSIRPASTNMLVSRRFWGWPYQLASSEFCPVPNLLSARYRDGRLWCEIEFKSLDIYLRKAFVIGIDPKNFSIVVVELPLHKTTIPASSGNSQDVYDVGASFEVLHNYLFYGAPEGLRRYSLDKKTWEDIGTMQGGLTVLDGRLFVVSDDRISEVAQDGRTQQILASTRRRPPLNILDSLEHLGAPALFHGPNGDVAAQVKDKVFVLNQDHKNWSELSRLPESPGTVPRSPVNEIVALSYRPIYSGTNLALIPTDQSSIVMSTPLPSSLSRTSYTARQCQLENPIWSPPDYRGFIASRCFLPEQKAWLFFGDHRIDTNHEGLLVVRGRKAHEDFPQLHVFQRDLGRIVSLPIHFDLGRTRPEDLALQKIVHDYANDGKPALQTIPTEDGFAALIPRFGLWIIPWSDLNRTLTAALAEKRDEQRARSAAIQEQWAKLQQQYHLTQRETFRPEEKEAMIDDPAFLELELDKIDANHNGRLDAEELIYFDANQNKELDPKERSGIGIAQNLLAQVLLNEFDRHRDGKLQEAECLELWNETEFRGGRRLPPLIPSLRQFDKNGDGEITIVELEAFLKDHTMKSLMPNSVISPDQAARMMKGYVEGFWARARGESENLSSAELLRRMRMTNSPAYRKSLTNSPPAPTLPEVAKSPDESLLEAAATGELAAAKAALEKGAKVDVRDDRGWSPLMIAGKEGYFEVVKLLVAKGADVNAGSTSKIGSTVLGFSVGSDSPELMGFLMDHGAEVNRTGNAGIAPLYYAVSYSKTNAAKFLLSRGAKVDQRGWPTDHRESFTPLMAAVSDGKMEMAKILLGHGANIEATNQAGDTLLMYLSKYLDPAKPKFLINHGANVNATGPDGHTALIYAAFNGRTETVKLLLAAGANPNAIAHDPGAAPGEGYDAVKVANQQGYREVAAVIAEARKR